MSLAPRHSLATIQGMSMPSTLLMKWNFVAFLPPGRTRASSRRMRWEVPQNSALKTLPPPGASSMTLKGKAPPAPKVFSRWLNVSKACVPLALFARKSFCTDSLSVHRPMASVSMTSATMTTRFLGKEVVTCAIQVQTVEKALEGCCGEGPPLSMQPAKKLGKAERIAGDNVRLMHTERKSAMALPRPDEAMTPTGKATSARKVAIMMEPELQHTKPAVCIVTITERLTKSAAGREPLPASASCRTISSLNLVRMKSE
mmetsp:Transcript_49275/g.140996  ORF Transcript_49275/g.140996 Transcript_49275/m.140996 type:complete len:258 (-) Transcript_49275:1370-2143(-)